MKDLTEEQKKEINEIKDRIFKELEEHDKERNMNDKEIKLDSGQGNSIISKYKEQIKKYK